MSSINSKDPFDSIVTFYTQISNEINEFKKSIDRRTEYLIQLKKTVAINTPKLRNLATQYETEKRLHEVNLTEIEASKIRISEDKQVLSTLQTILTQFKEFIHIQVHL